ncbi:MAG: ABC transporter ATP-binding protein/permease [Bacilli bacterium]|nr:ABC transporter ATP-binding protein/permease [Bacilli bacterium]
MKQILKLFKPILIGIIATIILLFVQARLELKLPDYTANIVNTGIQQSGVEKAVYKEISASSMNRLLLFTDKDDEILSNYKLLDKTKSNIKKYPLLKEEDIYVLKNNVNKNRVEKLLDDPIFIKNMIDNADKSPEVEAYLHLEEGVNVEALYYLFESMEEEELGLMLSGISENLSKIPSGIKTQSNIASIITEYKHIGIDTDQRQLNYLYTSGFKMLIISFVVMIISILVCFLSGKISARFAHDLRSKLVNKIMTFSNKEYEEFSTASLITRTTNDVQQIQMFLLICLRIVIFAPIFGLGALSKVWGSSLAWIIGLAVLIIFALIIFLFAISLPKFKVIQKVIDKVNLISREILTGLPVIRAFANEKHEEERFDKANKDLTRINLFVNRIMVFMMPFMSFIMQLVAIAIVWFGAKNVDTGSLQVGDIMALITYSMQIIISFLMISMVSIILPRAIVSFKRVSEVFNKKSTILDPKEEKKIPKKDEITVKFNDVSFMYHDAKENVIEDITFEAKPGTTTAIIGSTGCGKSSLINLIPRFFDVTKGSITLNDVDIRDIKLSTLRDLIGYVPQKGYLFSGDIKSNIKLSRKKIADQDMIDAAKIAQAEEFINKKEHKYEEAISEGGNNVSGGQKQRLAIARALALKPRILIFDDSFSALDYKTDSKLRKSIKKNTKNITTFIVAQRISTVLDADQIIVLDSGKIVGIGTHNELMKKCSVYKEIALSQLSKEELS